MLERVNMISFKTSATAACLLIFSLANAMEENPVTPGSDTSTSASEIEEHFKKTCEVLMESCPEHNSHFAQDAITTTIRTAKIARKDKKGTKKWLVNLKYGEKSTTFMHEAAMMLNDKLVIWLLKNEASFDALDADNKTPLERAQEALAFVAKNKGQYKDGAEVIYAQSYQRIEREIIIAKRKKEDPAFSVWRSLLCD
jgi:hypothetical protein